MASAPPSQAASNPAAEVSIDWRRRCPTSALACSRSWQPAGEEGGVRPCRLRSWLSRSGGPAVPALHTGMMASDAGRQQGQPPEKMEEGAPVAAGAAFDDLEDPQLRFQCCVCL